jgi:hypothetical protein
VRGLELDGEGSDIDFTHQIPSIPLVIISSPSPYLCDVMPVNRVFCSILFILKAMWDLSPYGIPK